ncbi:hypothetical protein [Rhodovulum steppense]|uniref:Uncharacterized protein n=1 Tax=Rhodovulum steppense TaxID=540251 RepID=A0A4R1YQX8_9RHOB|nr:hypothetical protein [Rhodovulum steppense]TCM81487.1 hypothetical protein EV216_11830 [Rhodovulum steppense]
MPNRHPAATGAIIALMLGTPLPLAAQDGASTDNDFALACAFDRECHEAEPCTDADFALDVTGRVGGMGAGTMLARVVLSSVSGDVDAFGTLDGGTMFLQGGDGASRSYLVVTNGAARYTLHMAEGPTVVTYHGTCE